MTASEVFGVPADRSGWAVYHGEVAVRGVLVGGVPKDPDTIKKWLESRLELDDRTLIEMAEAAAAEMEEATGERPNADQLLSRLSEGTGGNGFKRRGGALIYEARCLKAGIKEAANVAYPGTQWPGKPAGIRKGLMRYVAERVFVESDIDLGVTEATGTEQRVKHIMTPQGPRSAINVVDIVEQPKLSFAVKVKDDCLPPEVWYEIWSVLEEIGLGADRARSDGRFDLLSWERIS